MRLNYFLLFISLFAVSCSQSTTPSNNREFDLIFSYGVLSRNVLNTFQNTYTKDLVLDGTFTIPLTLSGEELNQISNKMNSINFFAYPDTFIVHQEEQTGIITPNSTYKFVVKSKSLNKSLYWDDFITNPDAQADSLRSLNKLIISIIQSKPEYAKLPPAKGGYL